MRSHLNKLNAEKGIRVVVTDLETNTVTIYDSIRKAAEALNYDKTTIAYQEIKKSKGIFKPFRKRYDINVIR